MKTLWESIPEDWRGVLSPRARDTLSRLEAFLEGEPDVLPPRERLFAALAKTPLAKVKVVMLGQDPYPTPGHATGLAFSVSSQTKLPGSLRNLYLGLNQDVGRPLSDDGDLSRWAQDGVLLLNTVLSVRARAPLSHRKMGWEELTFEWLSAVARLETPVVFFSMGKPAQALVEKLTLPPRHLFVRTPHPSPLSRGAFLKAVQAQKPFSQANAFLEVNGRGAVPWE